MSYEIKRIRNAIKREGVLSLAGKSFRYTRARIYASLVKSQIRGFKDKNSKEIVQFSFNNFKGLIKPMQVKSEITKLLEILEKNRPRVIIEIGTANGGTLFSLSRIASDDAFIISVDLPGGEFGGGYPRWKIPLYNSFAIKNQKMYLVRADSHKEETLRKVKSILEGRKVDLLFIDGDHSYEGVKKDFEIYKSLVKKNGIIVFHDIVRHATETNCNVDKFWREIKKKYKNIEIIEDKNQGWGGIGLIYT